MQNGGSSGMNEDERDEIFTALDTPSAKSKLHEIELDIIEGLKARPFRTWCVGCVRLLRALHAKATGADWRKL